MSFEKELDRMDKSLDKLTLSLKKSPMKYQARWQEYERYGNGPVKNINFTAESDRDALYKIFKKKILDESLESSLEDFLEEENITEKDLTLEYLKDLFDGIDVSGWPFLYSLTNKTTGEVVFDMGLDDEDEEDWED